MHYNKQKKECMKIMIQKLHSLRMASHLEFTFLKKENILSSMKIIKRNFKDQSILLKIQMKIVYMQLYLQHSFINLKSLRLTVKHLNLINILKKEVFKITKRIQKLKI